MHASLKVKHKSHNCLPRSPVSSTWSGVPNPPCAEVADQCAPGGAEPTSRHQNMATAGGIPSIKTPE